MPSPSPAHALSSSPLEGPLADPPCLVAPAPCPTPSASDALDAHASPVVPRRRHDEAAAAYLDRYALAGRLASAIVSLLRRHGVARPVRTGAMLRERFRTDEAAAQTTLDGLGLPDAVAARVANVAATYACDTVVRPDVRRAYEAACARHATRSAAPDSLPH